jgi:hypothetical protein
VKRFWGITFHPIFKNIIAISVMATISDLAIHDAWLPLGQSQFNTNRLISKLKKFFPNQFLEPNDFEFSRGKKVIMLFQHEYQRTKSKIRQRLHLCYRRFSNSNYYAPYLYEFICMGGEMHPIEEAAKKEWKLGL